MSVDDRDDLLKPLLDNLYLLFDDLVLVYVELEIGFAPEIELLDQSYMRGLSWRWKLEASGARDVVDPLGTTQSKELLGLERVAMAG